MRRPTVADRAARAVLRKLLAGAERGHLVIADDDGDHATFGARRPEPDGSVIEVAVAVHDPRTYRAVLAHGGVGLGQAYIDGWWDTDDLTGLLRLLNHEARRLDPARNRLAGSAGRVADRVRAVRHRPDRHRDRANVRAHYDLGNEFFELVLDDTMSYSSAWFPSTDAALAEASTEKMDRMCRRIGLGPDDHLVEIGTGWGGFAMHAASRYGCRVTTTTVSRAQFEYATARVAAAGLAGRVEVRHDDYRDLTGSYDKLVSIEMIEAVDWRDLDTFFATCQRLLRPDGVMGLQAIVMPDDRYERAKNTEDFIKAFVFPGGCLHSIGSIARSAARAGDLSITDLEGFGLHYAETLRRWRRALDAAADRLPGLGLDERFRRLWDFYLCYSEAGFDDRVIDVVQCTLSRRDARPRAPRRASAGDPTRHR